MRSFALAVALALTSTPSWADDGSSVDPSLRGPGSIRDASPQRRQPMISAFLGLPLVGYLGYGFPLALGGRYLHPLLHDGFIPVHQRFVQH